MQNNNLAKINNYNKMASTQLFNNKEYNIYTPEIIQRYKEYFKRLLKFTNDKTETKFIMYNKVLKWYNKKEFLNVSMEKIYIRSKLDSYTSGGCGIIGSFFAGLIASSVFSFIDDFFKKLNPIFLVVYIMIIILLGVKFLSNEDKNTEMYNVFLEVLNKLDNDNNEKEG